MKDEALMLAEEFALLCIVAILLMTVGAFIVLHHISARGVRMGEVTFPASAERTVAAIEAACLARRIRVTRGGRGIDAEVVAQLFDLPAAPVWTRWTRIVRFVLVQGEQHTRVIVRGLVDRSRYSRKDADPYLDRGEVLALLGEARAHAIKTSGTE